MTNKNGIKVIVKPAPTRTPHKREEMVDESIINLNTHIIRVKNDRIDVTWQPSAARPIIRYKHIPDPKTSDAYILKTTSIDGLPEPRNGVLFIVNRDTITATRKLEISLRKEEKFAEAFKIIDENPDSWVSLVQNELSKEEVQELSKYVGRTDLRAPGEQVRRKDNVISHCKELISEFE